MEQSSFQFSNPNVSRLELTRFDVPPGITDLLLETTFKVRNQKLTENTAVVSLKIEINNPDVIKMTEDVLDNLPFSLDLVIESEFNWDESIDEDLVNILLKVNAPSLLLSYARPIIQSTTGMTNYPPVMIPFFDFSTI